ncbi:pyridoxamine 5'-phosphate oxidase family protein [Nesterenkonia massiliensis]|uniref:pyridoxamine 5'-phosphate oxidase family protein n=1 Tax=Nesterenkonia massiliensis TaxID=1232429 RepID=UPI0030B7F87B
MGAPGTLSTGGRKEHPGMFNHPTDDPILVLTEEQSWQLLSSAELGRLVLVVGGRPDIFPVNIAADGHSLVFRTAPGTKLAELSVNEQVLVEADAFSPEGWSVVVRGTAERLETSQEIAHAESLGLHSWVPTLKDFYVRATPTEASGRHFLFGPQGERELGSGSDSARSWPPLVLASHSPHPWRRRETGADRSLRGHLRCSPCPHPRAGLVPAGPGAHSHRPRVPLGLPR